MEAGEAVAEGEPVAGAGAAAASAAAAAGGGDDGEEEECCLCMEPFRRDDQVRLLPCKHFFHAACVDQWFETKRYQVRSCPLCKQDPLAGTEGETFRQRDAQEVVARVLEEAAAEAEAAEAEAAVQEDGGGGGGEDEGATEGAGEGEGEGEEGPDNA